MKEVLQSPNVYYEVIREEKFEKSFEAIRPKYERADEVEANIDWMLARKPKFFPRVGPQNYHVWKTENIGPDFPEVVIVYEVDDLAQQVKLIDIMEI